MNIKSVLKIVLSVVLVFMVWEIIETSLESNLFTELPSLIKIPWMEATLFDFYANVLVISFWVAYKETSLTKTILWIVFLITMGSVATCVYVLKELFALKEEEGLRVLLTRRNG
jgi:hypothetical protein